MGTKDGLTAWKAIELLFPETERSAVYPWAALYSFIGLLREDSWYATGYRVSSVKPERISCDLWDILEIDLDSNTASSRVLEYEGLRFYEAGKVALQKRGYDDLPLIERMHESIAQHRESITEAANRLAPEAVGGGTIESRAKRLERKYIQIYGS